MARMLLASNSMARSPSSSSSSPLDAEQPQKVMIESDFVVILAALLCALICVVGLISVARCAWLRRGNNSNNNRRPVTNTPANRGLKKKVVQSLPKYTFDSSVDVDKQGDVIEATDCAICLTEYIDGDEIRVLPLCGHKFHLQCIDLWLGSHSSCPSCRQILVGVRCQKCGEVPPDAGVSYQAEVQAGSKSSLDCGTSSSSNNFNV